MSEFRMIHAPNLIAVLVDAFKKDGDMSGRLVTLYDEDPLDFHSTTDMLIRMDALYDDWNYPQRATSQRFFGKDKRTSTRNIEPEHLTKRGSVRSVEDLYSLRGEAATFVIQTQMRQNASWQGQAFYLEPGQMQQFQSVLELMRMMDEALNALS